MSKLKEYSKVRIRKLIQNPDEYDDWQVNQNPPEVGDTGTLIDILSAQGLPDKGVNKGYRGLKGSSPFMIFYGGNDN